MPKTIVVPLDGSEYAERAFGTARALAARTHAHLVLATSVVGGPAEPDTYLAAAATRAGVDGTETVAFADRGAVDGLAALVDDLPEPVVCMSTHGRSGVGQALLGSVAETLIARLRVPLLLVGPEVGADLAPRFDTALVCTDGSPLSKAIVAPVSEWVRQLHLRTWIVQVLDPATRRDLPSTTLEENAVYSMAQELMQRDGGGVNWDVLHGDDVADAIVDYARGVPASLIAMATHGRSGFARIALGSVATSVVHRAPCPVLVVRPDGLR